VNATDTHAPGEKEIGAEGGKVRKVTDEIVHQVHLVIGIITGELDPVADKDAVVRRVNAKK
jgi:hypothetical protein